MSSNTIGFKLKKAREAKNLSLRQVANSINCEKEIIENWENDKTLPNIDYLIPLSKLLSINIEDLLKKEGPSDAFNASILVSSIKHSMTLTQNSLPKDIEDN